MLLIRKPTYQARQVMGALHQNKDFAWDPNQSRESQNHPCSQVFIHPKNLRVGRESSR